MGAQAAPCCENTPAFQRYENNAGEHENLSALALRLLGWVAVSYCRRATRCDSVHRAKQLTAQLWLHRASYSLSLFFPHITMCTEGRGRGFSFPFSARCCDCTKSVQRFLSESREESEISSSVTVWVLCNTWGVQKALVFLPWHRCELEVLVCQDLSIQAGMVPEESRCTKPSTMGYCSPFVTLW